MDEVLVGIEDRLGREGLMRALHTRQGFSERMEEQRRGDAHAAQRLFAERVMGHARRSHEVGEDMVGIVGRMSHVNGGFRKREDAVNDQLILAKEYRTMA